MAFGKKILLIKSSFSYLYFLELIELKHTKDFKMFIMFWDNYTYLLEYIWLLGSNIEIYNFK